MIEHAPYPATEFTITRAAMGHFRHGLPDCFAALWTDMEADIVLASDAALDFPQEQLDALCMATSQALSAGLGAHGALPDQVIVSAMTECRVILRDPAMPTHALTCICRPEADLAHILQAMGRFLATGRRIGVLS